MVNVAFTGDDDAVIVLVDVQTIEVGQEAEVFEWWGVLGRELEALANAVVDALSEGLVGTGKGEVIHLAKEQDLFTIKGGRVDRSVVSGVAKLEFVGLKNGVNVGLPEATRFRVALESMEYRENH